MKSVKAFSSYVSAKKKPVGYIQTRASTGLVINHCAVAMLVTQGSIASHPTLSPNTFSLVTHRFGAMGRNMLQWQEDNYNRAP